MEAIRRVLSMLAQTMGAEEEGANRSETISPVPGISKSGDNRGKEVGDGG